MLPAGGVSALEGRALAVLGRGACRGREGRPSSKLCWRARPDPYEMGEAGEGLAEPGRAVAAASIEGEAARRDVVDVVDDDGKELVLLLGPNPTTCRLLIEVPGSGLRLVANPPYSDGCDDCGLSGSGVARRPSTRALRARCAFCATAARAETGTRNGSEEWSCCCAAPGDAVLPVEEDGEVR